MNANNIKKRLRPTMFLLLFSIMLQGTILNAQQSITGKVSDTGTGETLIGATVVVKGTTNGTITNIDGNYSLSVSNTQDTLLFSFIGYKNQEIPIAGQSIINIGMIESEVMLSEMVVIGYGTVKKSDLTGSIAVISSDDLNRIPASNFTSALQGRAAGVLVTQTGSPGSSAQIRIRGIGSINQNPNPIYVIDGVITRGLGNVNPTDIETIQVLKDASAAAIYGADGANGVIIITTKRGVEGKPKVSLSSYISINRIPNQFEVMNADEYSDFYSTLLEESNINTPVAYEDHFRQWYYGEGWQEGTNWQDEITEVGISTNTALRISGGGDDSNYSISINNSNENGIEIASAANRFNLRANSDFKIGKYIKIGESISLSRTVTQTPSTYEGNPWQVSLVASPLMRMFNENNKGGYEGPQVPYEYIMPDGTSEIVNNTGYNDKPNPRGPMEIGNYMSYNNNVLASMYLEIKPVKWLIYKLTPSFEGSYGRTKNWFPSFDMGVRSRGQAELTENYYEGVNLSLENQLTYTNNFGLHKLTATAVYHVRKNEINSLNATAIGFPYEQLNVISQSFEEGRQVQGNYSPFTSQSYLGRVIYDYNSKYLFTASLRYDGNSRFGPENRWGTFPSVSVAWKISEDFLTNIEDISMLKLRLGWGQTGNSAIGSFQYQSLMDNFSQFSPVFGLDQRLAPALNVLGSFGNPSIKWEAADMLNFGFDLNMFNNKFQFSAEYYIKNQNDLLVRVPMSSAFGRISGAGDPWVNLGEIQNRGFELIATYRKMEGAFNYNISGNFTTVKNEVNYIPSDILSGNNITTLGHTIGSFFGYVAERILTTGDYDETGNYLHAQPASGKPSPGDLKFQDLNNDGTINDLDRTIIGKAIPDFVYSLNMEAYYKNFDMSVFFYGTQNIQVYNHLRAGVEGFSSQDMGHNKLVDYAMNYYREDRPSTQYIRADINNSNQNDRASTWFLEEASFFRLKDIQLGYSLPEYTMKKIGVSRARLYLSATNLLTLTQYSGRDPEASTVSGPLTPGNDGGTYPVPKTISFGIQVDF